MSELKRIYLSSPHMSGDEMKYIREAFDQNWVAPLGPNVDHFEKDIAIQTGVKHAAVLNSGTSAIHLALILLGVERGDEVIASSFTFSATINPIAYLGAIPILIDSEPDTWNMDPDLLEKAIKDRMKSHKGKRIKAIIGADLYGMPARWKEIQDIANKYAIPVVEDAAESLGSRYNDRMCGSFGKFGILSFNGNKIITTSGGGALLSDDKSLIDRARYLSTQARDPALHYQHSAIGYNYRMSNILAGIGRGQLEVLNERVSQRRIMNKKYRELLKGINGIKFQTEPSNHFYSNYWLTCVEINPLISGKESVELMRVLEQENIESRPLWKPMHQQPVFSNCPAYLNGTSDRLFANGICLPSGSNMTEEDQERVFHAIKRFLSNKRN